MKFLFYDMGSYTYEDFIFYLKEAGHSCKTICYHFPDKFNDDFFCERFVQYLKADTYDVVISINFYPLIAKLCHNHQIKYISWCYDSPLDERLQAYFHYDTNYIFLFDRVEVEQYHALGYNQVFHLPLAVNTQRLDSLQFTKQQITNYSADISFVGQLYNSPLQTLLYSSDNYTRGYIEGILQAQLRIYGYNFLDELVTDELLDTINTSFKSIGQTALKLNHRGLVYAISTEITHIERTFLLEQLGEYFYTNYYSSAPCTLNSIHAKGSVNYHTEMPCVFRHSKLNLNPTLKCIQSGIPLRALDIMGAQGVLLSNYQPELAEYFESEVDCIMYTSIEDAIEKASFYLDHDNLRQQIGINGYLKTKEYFSYPERIRQMFLIANL